MRKVFKWIAGGLAVAVVLLLAAIRLAPDDPAVWHVDPAGVAAIRPTNAYLVAPEGATAAVPNRTAKVYTMAPEALAAAFDQVAMAAPRTARLAGSQETGWTTYVQRTKLMGYPDYISVRAVAVEGGAALIVYSRARYGKGDWGVNKARVDGWLEELDRMVG
jgi:uncharacterized protein (DUF1499 family)